MRALISVSNKDGVVDFARSLAELGIELISTGGTFQAIKEAGVAVTQVKDVTGFEEILEGRVKTLHPYIHGGILADRRKESHRDQLKELGITPIDLVVVNLYPFRETIKGQVSLDEAIEKIDIGGPTMVRAAAKNFHSLAVVVEPEDYDKVLAELRAGGEISLATRKKLSVKAFEHTANYDVTIAAYFRGQIQEDFEKTYQSFTFANEQKLRYGENPHQKAAYYGSEDMLYCKQLWGKELSYNNINDASGAISLLMEFEEPTAVNVKHANPCGVASEKSIFKAYCKAYEADPVSVFGGIVAVNRTVDKKLAEKFNEIFLEIIIAPDYTQEALELLKVKKNRRLLQLDPHAYQGNTLEMKSVIGGLLVQEVDRELIRDLEVVTKVKPSAKELEDLLFAYKVVKHQKSNAIALVKDLQTLGLGTGQVSRVFAAENSVSFARQETQGAVLASDAFFPFKDAIMHAVEAGVKAIIQPGGSVRDEEVIAACDEHGIAMIFTGLRHFKH